MSKQSEADEKFRSSYVQHQNFDFTIFKHALSHLTEHMNAIGDELGSMWDHERFIREMNLQLE